MQKTNSHIGDLYDIGDIIGKTLYPTRTLNVYDHPEGNIVGIVSPPNAAGVVYSWVNGSDGAMWWMFDGANSNLANQYGSYYIKQESGAFNVQALRAQGVITIKEKIEQQKKANKDTLSRIEDIVKWVALTIAGAVVAKVVLQKIK